MSLRWEIIRARRSSARTRSSSSSTSTCLLYTSCNGFQALIKLGLVPYGEIVDIKASDPTLTFNKIGRHQSTMVRTKVVSNRSPWLSECELGGVYTVGLSHGEGRFVCSEKQFAELVANGQIASQYVDCLLYTSRCV